MKANDDRHDHSVETTWNAMLDLEKRFSTNVLWDLLSMQTLRDLENQNAGMYTLIAGTHPVDSVQEQLLEGAVDRVKPFLGETLYDIFSIHRAVVFRAAFDLHCVVCEQSDEHWLTDQLVHNALDGLIDLDGQPDLGDVLARLKRRFCAVYAGVVMHTPTDMPTDTPKSLGFRPGMPSAAG